MPDTSTPQRAAPGQRRRLPSRVYWRRRIAVLAVMGVVLWAGVTAVGGLFDDGDTGESIAVVDDRGSSTDAGSNDAAASETAAGAGEVAGDERPADGGAAESLASPDGGGEEDPGDEAGSDDAAGEETQEAADDAGADDEPPSVDNPASVHIVGDSDAGTFGPYLQTLLDNTLIVDTSLDYKVSSGLARPDFFNWPEQLATTVPEVDPDIVVVTFGGNDSQGLSKAQDELEFVVGDPLTNEEEWSAEYERRVLEVIDILLEDGRQVVWVGSPNDDNPEVTAKLAIQDQAVRSAIEQRPGVVFVDTWNRFSGRDGNWAEFVVDPRDGVGKDVRADDGYHLNVVGAEILAIDIAVEIRDLLRERGAAI